MTGALYNICKLGCRRPGFMAMVSLLIQISEVLFYLCQQYMVVTKELTTWTYPGPYPGPHHFANHGWVSRSAFSCKTRRFDYSTCECGHNAEMTLFMLLSARLFDWKKAIFRAPNELLMIFGITCKFLTKWWSNTGMWCELPYIEGGTVISSLRANLGHRYSFHTLHVEPMQSDPSPTSLNSSLSFGWYPSAESLKASLKAYLSPYI